MQIKIDTSEYDELLLDVVIQACGIEDNKIDHQCITAYEEACDYLADKFLLISCGGRKYELRRQESIVKNIKQVREEFGNIDTKEKYDRYVNP